MLRVICVAAILCGQAAMALAGGKEVEITFKNHLQYNLVEQHVYVERAPGSGEIYRVTPLDRHRYMDSPLYATANPVPNAPMDHGAVGPYERGAPLDLTLGEWLAGTGVATVKCKGKIGSIKATFDGLIPNAIYTLWHSLVPRPPLDPFVALDIPLGARDGSTSPFGTDETGHAVYEASISPCLQYSGVQVDTMLAIAWHSDGKTYGPSPGPFSTVTHVQVFGFFPIEE